MCFTHGLADPRNLLGSIWLHQGYTCCLISEKSSPASAFWRPGNSTWRGFYYSAEWFLWVKCKWSQSFMFLRRDLMPKGSAFLTLHWMVTIHFWTRAISKPLHSLQGAPSMISVLWMGFWQSFASYPFVSQWCRNRIIWWGRLVGPSFLGWILTTD